VSENFHPVLGGGQLTLWKQVRRLNRKGHDITVVTSRVPGTESREVNEGIEIVRPFPSGSEIEAGFLTNMFQQMKRLKFSLKLYPFLDDFLDKRDFDVVINLAFIPTVPTTWISRKRSIPCVTNVRSYGGRFWLDMTNPITAIMNMMLEILTLKLGKHESILCPSLDTKKKLETILDVDLNIIHNPFDVEKIREIGENTDKEKVREDLGIEPEESFLLFVGSLYPVKNVARVVEELPLLQKKFKFVIIGDGPEKKSIRKKASLNGLEHRLIFLGKKKHEETLRIMSACDTLILPSLTETFSNVIIEALILNRQVVSTDVGIAKEIESPNLSVVEDIRDIPDVLNNGLEPKKDPTDYTMFSHAKIITRLEHYLREVAEYRE